MSSILKNALSGLQTSSTALNTVSNNVANVNKEGYARQNTIIVSNQAQRTAIGFEGQGVRVSTVERSHSDFLQRNMADAQSKFAYFDAGGLTLNRIDRLYSDDAAGIGSAMSDFFKAAQDLSGNPADIPTRQNFFAAAESIAARFNSFDLQFQDIKRVNNESIQSAVLEVNAITRQIAQTNEAIRQDELAVGNKAPNNALLDQRDLLIQKLSKFVDIRTLPQNNGTVNVFLASGQPLVSEVQSFDMVSKIDPRDNQSIAVGMNKVFDGEEKFVRFGLNQIKGGELGGLMRVAETEIPQYEGDLGLIASRFMDEVNAIQANGLDLQGNAGIAMFTRGNNPLAITFADESNANPSVNIQILDQDINTEILTRTNFEVTVDNGNVLVYPTGKIGEAAQAQPVVGQPGKFAVLDPTSGNTVFEFTLSELNNQDRFSIKLTRNASSTIQLNLDSVEQIATAKASDPNNPTFFSGDNRNILDLTDLQNKVAINLNGRGTTLADAFNKLATDTANDARLFEVSGVSRLAIFEDAVGDRESVSGVNLDEEAANLLRFQQSYQANSQVISIAKELFADLLSAIR